MQWFFRSADYQLVLAIARRSQITTRYCPCGLWASLRHLDCFAEDDGFNRCETDSLGELDLKIGPFSHAFLDFGIAVSPSCPSRGVSATQVQKFVTHLQVLRTHFRATVLY